MKTKEIQCMFCGVKQDEEREDGSLALLIAMDETAICDKCVENCNEALGLEVKPSKEDKKEFTFDVSKKKFPKPSQIRKHLDRYVINQDKAKEVLSVAVYNHYKTIAYKKQKNQPVDIKKSNIMMLGPTGTGRQYV